MKILFTGGGSGGHFYPLIAVAQKINHITHDEKLITPELFFMSDSAYDSRALFENDITFEKVSTGKLRRYFSIRNIIDTFKTIRGVAIGFFKVFRIYPDVVFGKGGYASFPALLSAKILRIPVFIHESDTVPGRTNRWAGKFARRIAVSYAQTTSYFPQDKVAWTGNPVREEIIKPIEGAHELLQFDKNVPTVLVLGGSQGAQRINDAILDILPELVSNFQVIHQVGGDNIKLITEMKPVVLKDADLQKRYKAFGYLDNQSMQMAASCADIIISRAGSTIFEIALWGEPSIIIPITDSNGDHQRQNARAYEQSGSCLVIEEANLKPHILLSEIKRIVENPELKQRMADAARAFAKPDAAEKIAHEIIRIALTHEK